MSVVEGINQPDPHAVSNQSKKEFLVEVACPNCDSTFDNIVFVDIAIVGMLLSCTICGDKHAFIRRVFD